MSIPVLCALLLSLSCRESFGPNVQNFDDAFRMAGSKGIDANAFEGWYGADNLKNGTGVRSEDLRFIFALRSTAKKVAAVADDGTWSTALVLAKDDLWTAGVTMKEGAGFRWHYEADGQRIGGGELEAYTTPKEGKPQPGVSAGSLREQPLLKSEVYPGASRKWWIYEPATIDASKPLCLLIVQDGQWSRGYWPVYLDNLIAQKDIPQMIAVFLEPGTITKNIDNRSVEYDTVSARYPDMLEKELLPRLYATYPNLRKDANGHMITGLSSGGICSFNAAWQRPDLFHKVLSWIGSYTNLQGGPTGVAGGNTLPAIIRDRRGWDRKGEPKPIRVFLQDGGNDLDNKAGSWPLANQDMARALAYGGYDYQFVMGNGFHSDKHGRVLIPEAMRWLWRDEK